MYFKEKKGFTLIELLIVIAIIAILSAVVFVALNPLVRFQDTRDSRRWSDVSEIMTAVKLNQVDNGGNYLYGVMNYLSGATVVDTKYMISNSTSTAESTCTTGCSTYVTGVSNCVNLQGLVDSGAIGSLPVNPTGAATWSSTYTGYYLSRKANGILTIGSCENEHSATAITVTR